MLVTKQLMPPIDFFFPQTMEVNGYRQMFGYPRSSKYIFLLLCSTEKKTQTGLVQLEDE